MKLLFDEYLSARLVALLQADHPGSAHVEQLLGRGRSDAEAWEYARSNGFAVTSKDNVDWANQPDPFRRYAALSREPAPATSSSASPAGWPAAERVSGTAPALSRFRPRSIKYTAS